MAYMQCLAIQTADPRSVCWAGGKLEGEVTLILTEPMLVRGIRLSYRCEARVDYLDDGQAVEIEEDDDDDDDDDDFSGGRGRRRRTKKNFLDTVAVVPRRRAANEKFLETTSILWGTEPTTSYGEVMPAGQHALPFDIQVPSQLPGSFEGRYGFVRHWLECVVDRPGSPDLSTKRALSVISHCDLNKDPVAVKAIHHKEEVVLCCGCVRPDCYDVSYELPYRGYVPGETMFPVIRFRNFTRNHINVTIRLQMITTYKVKTRRKITTRVVSEDRKVIHKTEVTKWEPSLQIPALPPSGLGGCNIIDVKFLIEVDVTSRGVGWQGLRLQDEVRIGTIPLMNVGRARPLAQAVHPKMAVLLGPALSASQDFKVGGKAPNRPSSSSTGDGRLTSDADSASPLARIEGARRAPPRYQRSASLISSSSHWSFHPALKAAPRPLHSHFPWRGPGKGGGKNKARNPQKPIPAIYRC